MSLPSIPTVVNLERNPSRVVRLSGERQARLGDFSLSVDELGNDMEYEVVVQLERNPSRIVKAV